MIAAKLTASSNIRSLGDRAAKPADPVAIALPLQTSHSRAHSPTIGRDEEEDKVVADPLAEIEQPVTVVVDVSQASVVVVMVPLVTGDGEHVVNSASEVELSVQDWLLDEEESGLEDVDDWPSDDDGVLSSSLPYSLFLSSVIRFLRSSVRVLINLMRSSVTSPVISPEMPSIVSVIHLKRLKRLATHPVPLDGPRLGRIPSREIFKLSR